MYHDRCGFATKGELCYPRDIAYRDHTVHIYLLQHCLLQLNYWPALSFKTALQKPFKTKRFGIAVTQVWLIGMFGRLRRDCKRAVCGEPDSGSDAAAAALPSGQHRGQRNRGPGDHDRGHVPNCSPPPGEKLLAPFTVSRHPLSAIWHLLTASWHPLTASCPLLASVVELTPFADSTLFNWAYNRCLTYVMQHKPHRLACSVQLFLFSRASELMLQLGFVAGVAFLLRVGDSYPSRPPLHLILG